MRASTNDSARDAQMPGVLVRMCAKSYLVRWSTLSSLMSFKSWPSRCGATITRLRTVLGEKDDFKTVLFGAGLALIIRILASAIGYAIIILLARWMGPADYGLYSFAICLDDSARISRELGPARGRGTLRWAIRRRE